MDETENKLCNNDSQTFDMVEKAFDEWMEIENELCNDVKKVLDLVDQNGEYQPSRRALIRAMWGYIEGSSWGIRSFINEFSRACPDELPKVNGQRTLNTLKCTLNSVANHLVGGVEPDFYKMSGWQFLQYSYYIRNRLMYPKSVHDLIVSDEELEQAKQGVTWYIKTIWSIKIMLMLKARMAAHHS